MVQNLSTLIVCRDAEILKKTTQNLKGGEGEICMSKDSRSTGFGLGPFCARLGEGDAARNLKGDHEQFTYRPQPDRRILAIQTDPERYYPVYRWESENASLVPKKPFVKVSPQ